MSIKQLKTGDHDVALMGDVLYTGGIGSCVVVCLWDGARRIGGMAHMMLPRDDRAKGEERPPGMSPDTAIPVLLLQMRNLGATTQNIRARLIGAGNMFGAESGFIAMIGPNILKETKIALELAQIDVIATSVGGASGRQVTFDVTSGQIEVKTVDGKQIYL